MPVTYERDISVLPHNSIWLVPITKVALVSSSSVWHLRWALWLREGPCSRAGNWVLKILFVNDAQQTRWEPAEFGGRSRRVLCRKSEKIPGSRLKLNICNGYAEASKGGSTVAWKNIIVVIKRTQNPKLQVIVFLYWCYPTRPLPAFTIACPF